METDFAHEPSSMTWNIWLSVVVEALARLLSEPASIDHAAQKTGWSVLAITGFLVQDIHNGEAGVQTNEIGKG